jgi:hypothetical protein
MSTDRYFVSAGSKWVRSWEPVRGWNFWVDICHVALIDERYYFLDLSSALAFYLEGWKERQFLDVNGKDAGIDHSGLYSHGCLVQGRSIHGAAPGHEGANHRQICDEFVRRISEEEGLSSGN